MPSNEVDLNARRIGEVESVTAASLGVAIDPEAPHGVALGSGIPVRFPQVNGLVVIPTDDGSVVGIIHSIGIVPSDYPKRPGMRDYGLIDLPFPTRRLGVTPLGVLRMSGYSESGEARFAIDRGVLTPPTVGAAVLLPTDRELSAVLEGSTSGPRVEIGHAALSRNLSVRVDPDRLFGRHLAVLGNTGSGKSCTVAGLVRWSLEAARDAADPKQVNARFVIIDPNGEYAGCFDDLAETRVFKAQPDEDDRQLRVPAWLWNGAEWSAFSDASHGVQEPLLHQALRLLRAGADAASDADRRLATLTTGYLSVFSGVRASGPTAYAVFPAFKNLGQQMQGARDAFQVHESKAGGELKTQLTAVVSALDEAVNTHLDQGQYWSAFDEPTITGVVDAMEALRSMLPTVDLSTVISEDAPIPFDVPDVVSHLEVLAAGEGGSAAQFASTVGLRIRTMLGHARLRSVVGPTSEPEALEDWLSDYLGPATSGRPTVAVVDLSLVPGSLMHVVAAVVARVVFEALQRYRRLNGVELPTVLVLDEAHHFASRFLERDESISEAAATCRGTFETVAREGRKFGLGLVLSSQRPSEVSPTVLSQCNTFLLHRVVNDRDQELVRRLVPDNLGKMLDDLPVLPTQHGILLGWATTAPLLVRINDVPREHRPHSDDPLFWDTWTRQVDRAIDWHEVANTWREGAV